VNTDGDALTRITEDDGETDVLPQFSPDGSQISYYTNVFEDDGNTHRIDRSIGFLSHRGAAKTGDAIANANAANNPILTTFLITLFTSLPLATLKFW